MADFMEQYAAWQRLAEIAEQVPRPRGDDNPEMMAEIEAQHTLIALPADDLAALRAKASLPMLQWQGPSREHWACLRSDIERLAAKGACSAPRAGTEAECGR